MKKQVLSLVMVLLLILGSLAGCSGGENSSGGGESSAAEQNQSQAEESQGGTTSNMNAEGLPIVNDKVELSIFQYCRDNDQIDWENLWFYEQLEEETNIHITFDVATATDWATKLNLMLVSGEYNDIVMNRDGNGVDVEEYGVVQKIFVPLDDLIAEYMPIYSERVAMDPSIVESLKASDGQTYSMGYIVAQDIHCGNMDFINKTWLDNLGLEMPETVDELTEVLRAFRDQDANGNGDAGDEYPFEAVLKDFYKMSLSFFGVPENDQWVSIDDDAQVRLNARMDGYRDALEWMHLLYEEGLVDQEVLTQDSTNVDSKLLEGRAGLIARWRLLSHGIDEVKDDFTLMVPVDAEGYSAKMNTTMEVATPCALITCTNEYPEITARWLDNLLETQTAYEGYYGPEGEIWSYNENGKAEIRPEGDQGGTAYAPGVNSLFYGPAEWYFETFEVPDYRLEKAEYDDIYTEAGVYETYPADYLFKLVTLTSDENTTLNLHLTDLTNLITEMISNSIMTGVTDDSWNTFQNNLTGAGADDYVAVYQAALDRYLADQ